MKGKKGIYSSALTAILSVCATTVFAGGPEIIEITPDYFTGFFVGGTGSLHVSTFNVNSSTSINASTVRIIIGELPAIPVVTTSGPSFTTNSNNGASYDGYGGIQGGLGITLLHQYYLGVLGFGEWGKTTAVNNSVSNKNVGFAITGTTNIDTGQATTTQTVTSKLDNDYGVVFKPGYLITPNTMVYGEIGAVWANLEVTNNVSNSINGVYIDVADKNIISGFASGSSSNEQTKTALLLGLGFETFVFPEWFSHHVTVGAEYKFANFGHVTTTTTLSGTLTNRYTDTGTAGIPTQTFSAPVTGTISANASAKINTFAGFINVYFGREWL